MPLEQASILHDDSDLVNPSPQGSCCALSDMALTKLLRDCDLASNARVHGFRSTFKSWAVSEMALAHIVGTAVAVAYVRIDLFDLSRNLMDEWSAFAEAGHV